MIDLLFCAKGRPEFTRESITALVANTDLRLISSIRIYTDVDGASSSNFSPEFLAGWPWMFFQDVGGPVGALLDTILPGPHPERSEIVCKIDNDVIVPPFWLDQCIDVMGQHPELDLLGIEPWQSRTANPQTGKRGDAPDRIGEIPVSMHTLEVAMNQRDSGRIFGYAPTKSIGGIGLFRRRAFDRFPDLRAEGTYGGFTSWQLRHPELVIGWVVPPLKLFLLDRLPMDPWKALSLRYIREGQQRPWTDYSPEAAQELAGWWLDGQRMQQR